MTDREFTEIEGQKEGRETEQAESAKEARKLEEATTTPQSHVEAKIDYKESEGVETAFTDLVGTDKQLEPTEPPGTSGEEITKTKKKDGKDEATPINLPGPEAVAAQTPSTPGSEAEVIPINLPHPRPDEITGEVPSTPGSEAEVLPLPIPHPRPDGPAEEVPSNPGGEAEVIPINLPHPRPDEVVKETSETSDSSSGEETVVASEGEKPLPGKSSGEELSQGDAASLPPQRLDVELPEEQLQGMQKEADILQDATTGGFKLPGVDGLPGSGPPGSVITGESEMEDFNLSIEKLMKQIEDFKNTLEKDNQTPYHIGGGPGPIHEKFGGGYASKDPPPSSQKPAGKTKSSSSGSTTGTQSGSSNQETFVEIKNFFGKKYEDLSPKEKKEYDKLRDQLDAIETEAYHAKYVYTRQNHAYDSMNYKILNEELDKIIVEVEESKERLDFCFGLNMPRPDGGEEDDTSNLTLEDIKYENQAVDPAITQGGPQGSGLNEHKMQGIVSDPAEWQEKDIGDAKIKYDPSQVTDPSGDELSKGGEEAASKD